MAAAKVTGTWKRLLDSDTLRRSSQVVASFGNQLFLFGGEIQPRQPVDNHVHLVSLDARDGEQIRAPRRFGPLHGPHWPAALCVAQD